MTELDLDVVQYVLSSLKRAAENDYSWSLTPNEAGALVAEIEHLRAQRRLDNEEAARLYDFARDKGAALERADVVAWLREWAHPVPGYYDMSVRLSAVMEASDIIERGEHRTQGET